MKNKFVGKRIEQQKDELRSILHRYKTNQISKENADTLEKSAFSQLRYFGLNHNPPIDFQMVQCLECGWPDMFGNYKPCCLHDLCEPDNSLGMCIHCGGEMFEENGSWFHHSQEEIPFEDREPQLNPIKNE